jgi:hypothetical protein
LDREFRAWEHDEKIFTSIVMKRRRRSKGMVENVLIKGGVQFEIKRLTPDGQWIIFTAVTSPS